MSGKCEVCGTNLESDPQVIAPFCPNNCDRKRDRESQIAFYTTKGKYGFLSNFHRHYFQVDGKSYHTVEHYYQSMKGNSDQIREWIVNAPNPFLAMKAGRSLREDKELAIYWDSRKVSVMLTALRAKFTNSHMAEDLLWTGDKVIFEDSPTDMFWGGRLVGSKDMLGKLLMQVRNEIRDMNRIKKLGKQPSDRIIRKVKVLGSRCREQAVKMGLKDDDLVLVDTYLTPFPEYKLTLIEGSPTEFLQKLFFGEEVD